MTERDAPTPDVAAVLRAREPFELATERLGARYGSHLALDDVSIDFPPRAVTALMGPSGCGKTTLLRCLNRIHETISGVSVVGTVSLGGRNLLASDVDPIEVRRRIGMVFQQPNPFPTLSIAQNVLAGLRFGGRPPVATEREAILERALRSAALWDEVKDRLGAFPFDLSGGQQQRLCIARAVALEPEVLLMDEPTSSLDPIATLQVEELMVALARERTIVAVTHNLQQAARVSTHAVFFLSGADRIGRVVEMGETKAIFTHPRDSRTEDYITGRFG